jgi:hypothetical protein
MIDESSIFVEFNLVIIAVCTICCYHLDSKHECLLWKRNLFEKDIICNFYKQ